MEDACVAVPYLLEVPLQGGADELVPPGVARQLRIGSGSSGGSDGASTSTATAVAAATSAAAATATHDASHGAASLSLSGSDSFGHHHQQQHGNLGVATNDTTTSTSGASVETLHFFGVFDGHGGADAAMHCAKTLHERVKEVLSAVTSPQGAAAAAAKNEHIATAAAAAVAAVPAPEISSSGGGGGLPIDTAAAPLSNTQQPTAAATAATNISQSSSDSDFLDAVDMEAEGGDDDEAAAAALEGDGLGGIAALIEGVPCTTETVEAALTKAFHLTDEEFGEMGGYEHLALVGTTAVVALIGSRMIYVANCGDSRAVLCRDGHAVALTDDHKASRDDETSRVEAAGGQILFWNGVRVMGLLAVSRAIGDHSLRPYVIAEPEVTIVHRHVGDELLVMASDGLWDVMTNKEACTLAKKCLLRARQRGSSRQSAARVAATVLTRAAVDRGSRDNVTVVIVDLTMPSEDDDDAALQRTATESSEQGIGYHSHSISGGGGGSGSEQQQHLSSQGGQQTSREAAAAAAVYNSAPMSSPPPQQRVNVSPVPSPFDVSTTTSTATPSVALPVSTATTRAEALHRGSAGMTSPFCTNG